MAVASTCENGVQPQVIVECEMDQVTGVQKMMLCSSPHALDEQHPGSHLAGLQSKQAVHLDQLPSTSSLMYSVKRKHQSMCGNRVDARAREA